MVRWLLRLPVSFRQRFIRLNITLCGVTGRDRLYYLLGVLLLLVAVFIDRDLSDAQELLDGAVIFSALILGAIFVIYIKERGGTGPYVPG